MAQTPLKNLLYAAVYLPNYAKQAGFRGYARSVSASNVEGRFDILPQHENFVTLVLGAVTIIDQQGKRYELKLGQGLLEASNNLVKIFVEF